MYYICIYVTDRYYILRVFETKRTYELRTYLMNFN